MEENEILFSTKVAKDAACIGKNNHQVCPHSAYEISENKVNSKVDDTYVIVINAVMIKLCLLDNLKNLINQIDDSCCCEPCAPAFSPLDFPYLQVTILDPPCSLAPTWPKYVKPLTVPPPPKVDCDPCKDLKTGFANFYNFYNKDYRKTGKEFLPKSIPRRKLPCYAVTEFGTFPTCDKCPKIVGFKCADKRGCPTGFEPCVMDLCPPPCLPELSCWTATVMPCPPKRKSACKKCP
ncbi:hypothetical protein FQR65_LT07310 [Abscondita terminalis]|nr:hypothetical protein FQR65_LT07310 [Abscondita terminalis]